VCAVEITWAFCPQQYKKTARERTAECRRKKECIVGKKFGERGEREMEGQRRKEWRWTAFREFGCVPNILNYANTHAFTQTCIFVEYMFTYVWICECVYTCMCKCLCMHVLDCVCVAHKCLCSWVTIMYLWTPQSLYDIDLQFCPSYRKCCCVGPENPDTLCHTEKGDSAQLICEKVHAKIGCRFKVCTTCVCAKRNRSGRFTLWAHFFCFPAFQMQ